MQNIAYEGQTKKIVDSANDDEDNYDNDNFEQEEENKGKPLTGQKQSQQVSSAGNISGSASNLLNKGGNSKVELNSN